MQNDYLAEGVLPKYQSHKVVGAAKITGIGEKADNGSRDITVVLPNGEEQTRNFAQSELDNRPAPEVGGYVVRYKDGYNSFSPASAFDGEHTLLNKPLPSNSVTGNQLTS